MWAAVYPKGQCRPALELPPKQRQPPATPSLLRRLSPLVCPGLWPSSAAELASGREGRLPCALLAVSCTPCLPAGGRLGLVFLIVRSRLLTCT